MEYVLGNFYAVPDRLPPNRLLKPSLELAKGFEPLTL